MPHIPVLLEETIALLDPKPNENFIDATIGNGGHAKAILERIAPTGKLVGIDWNQEAIMKLGTQFKKEIAAGCLIPHRGNFAGIADIARRFLGRVDGIVADLGMSSEELEESGRGFSFKKDEPLLMTYDANPAPDAVTAEKIVNKWPETKLVEIFRAFGEEPFAKRYARQIIRARAAKPIRTSRELASLIETHAIRRNFRIHPATRIFQALRIAVNRELENLAALLTSGVNILAPEGRMAVISYHSLEDRIVKHEWRRLASLEIAEILTKKPVRPSRDELVRNPRSRSAKLRVVKKLL